jgi:hypothetical protein
MLVWGQGNSTLQDAEARQNPCRPHESIHGASSPSSFLGITLSPPAASVLEGARTNRRGDGGPQSVDTRGSGVSVALRVSSCPSLGGTGGCEDRAEGGRASGSSQQGSGEPCTNGCHTAKILAVPFWRALKALGSTWLVEWRGLAGDERVPQAQAHSAGEGKGGQIGEDARKPRTPPSNHGRLLGRM